jgi:hypothetical protein
MSADNGVYIAKFPDGYRVAHAQAIENIDYYPAGTKERKAMLKNYFEKSDLYETKEQAFAMGYRIESEFSWTEYGVCYVGEYESFE